MRGSRAWAAAALFALLAGGCSGQDDDPVAALPEAPRVQSTQDDAPSTTDLYLDCVDVLVVEVDRARAGRPLGGAYPPAVQDEVPAIAANAAGPQDTLDQVIAACQRWARDGTWEL